MTPRIKAFLTIFNAGSLLDYERTALK